MTDQKTRLLALLTALELNTPINELRLSGLETDIQGWGDDDPIFDYVIRHWHPRVILEVGSWKGASAIKMASIQKEFGIDGLIVCIDTFLGSNSSLWTVESNRKMLMMSDGFPQMFRQFQKNILSCGYQDRIKHMPMTSTAAAEILSEHAIEVDAIYIDAGHQEQEVYTDMQAYWPLLKPGGIFFGDDYSASWPGTVKAVNRFAAETGLKLRGTDWKWMFIKPT